MDSSNSPYTQDLELGLKKRSTLRVQGADRVTPIREERLSSYKPGGFHPTHLGDVINGRYRIMRKLGYNLSTTTWLAQDNKYILRSTL
jgi:hypothetical protein